MNLIDVWKSFWLGEDYAAAETLTGKSNVTISSRVAQARIDGKWWGVWGCKALNVLFMASDHCGGAITHDLERVRDAEVELEDCVKREAEATSKLAALERATGATVIVPESGAPIVVAAPLPGEEKPQP